MYSARGRCAPHTSQDDTDLFRALSRRRTHRQWRHGRGVPRVRHAAQPAGRGQGDARRADASRPTSSSGSCARRAPPRRSTTQHRHHPRSRRDAGRRALHRPGAHRRADAAVAHRERADAHRDGRHRAAGGARAGRGARRGHRPPRRQAREHHGPGRRLREGARLRARAGHRPSGGRAIDGRPIRTRRRGRVLGTAAYMSPEQAQRRRRRGPRPTSSRSASCCTRWPRGRRPFVAPSSMGVLAAILSEQPVPLVRLNPAIPPALDALVHRMLAKEPERRPSAREVDEELAALSGPRRAGRARTHRGGRGAQDRRPRGRACGPPARLRARQGRSESDPRRLRRGGHRQDEPDRGLPRRAGVAARAPDRRARPLLGTARRRRSVPADPRSARQPAPPRRRRVAPDADEDRRADVVPAGGDAVHRGVVDGRAPRRRADGVAGADEARGRRVLPGHLGRASGGALPRRPALGRRLDDRHPELPGRPLRRHARAGPDDLPAGGDGAGAAPVSRHRQRSAVARPVRGDRARVPRHRRTSTGTSRWSFPSIACRRSSRR